MNTAKHEEEIMKTLRGWRYSLTSALVLVLDEAIKSKVLPGANIRAAARIVNTHFSSPGRHGAGPGWAGPMVVLTCDQLRYPETALVTHQ